MTICSLESPSRNWASLNVLLTVCKSSSTPTIVHRPHMELMHLLQKIASTYAEDIEAILMAKLIVKIIPISEF